MAATMNPALQSFVAALGNELVLAQVLIRRREHGYELRHVADTGRADVELRLVPVNGLRELAQFTASGAFRPVKAAPNLRSGWRAVAADDAELDAALSQLYPGAVADWFAARAGVPPVTNYREFAGRQTGMYRVTAMLSDEQAARMIRACCAARFCLKQRLWTVAGLEADVAAGKSMIPCLEPCAVLLEFARKVMRLEQEDRCALDFGGGEMETIAAALGNVIEPGAGDLREADFSAPSNPRRVLWLLEKLRPRIEAGKRAGDEVSK